MVQRAVTRPRTEIAADVRFRHSTLTAIRPRGGFQWRSLTSGQTIAPSGARRGADHDDHPGAADGVTPGLDRNPDHAQSKGTTDETGQPD